jgi:hypothetical protein
MSPLVVARSAAMVLVACGAAAAQTPPDFLLTWDASNDGAGPATFNWTTVGAVQPGAGTGWTYSGEMEDRGYWTVAWSCAFSNSSGVVAAGGAFVTINMTVTNNDVNIQNFNCLAMLPLANPILLPQESGSVAGSVTDITGDGATLTAPAGYRIYTPRIDGVDEAPGFLLDAPYSQSALPFLSAVVGPASFGVVPASQDADTSIALYLSFDLSPGDTATFTSIFEITKVPGPAGAAALAALGLLGGGRRRPRGRHH